MVCNMSWSSERLNHGACRRNMHLFESSPRVVRRIMAKGRQRREDAQEGGRDGCGRVDGSTGQLGTASNSAAFQLGLCGYACAEHISDRQ